MVDRYIDTVQKTYIAYLGRPADPVGLAYWTGQLDQAGGDLSAIIAAFGDSAEAVSLLANKSYDEKIHALYQNLFSRNADDAGLAYYSGGLSSGAFTLSSVAMNIMQGTIGSDVALLANRLDAAKLFTNALTTTELITAYNESTVSDVRDWLAGVTSTAVDSTEVNLLLARLTFSDTLVESGGELVISGTAPGAISLDLGNQSLLVDGESMQLGGGSWDNIITVDASGVTGTGVSVGFIGTAAAETYVASPYGDSIRGAGGNDTLTGGSGADTFVFEKTAAENGLDTIKGFVAGGSDILDLSPFLDVTGTSAIAAVDEAGTDAVEWSNGDVIVVIGDGLTTAASIAALFGAGLAFAAPAGRGKAVVVATDIVGDAGVWYLVNQSDIGNVTADELTQVASLVGVNNLELVPFIAANFG